MMDFHTTQNWKHPSKHDFFRFTRQRLSYTMNKCIFYEEYNCLLVAKVSVICIHIEKWNHVVSWTIVHSGNQYNKIVDLKVNFTIMLSMLYFFSPVFLPFCVIIEQLAQCQWQNSLALVFIHSDNILIMQHGSPSRH